MDHLNGNAANVARFYDAGFEAEVTRLPGDSPVELAITTRVLERWIAPGASVVEIGVGGGEYSEVLARRQCSLYLVDVSERLLQYTTGRLHLAGLGGAVRRVALQSATSLTEFESGFADAVLLLGPLYHLCSGKDREAAVSESARILKRGGLLFAAGINRLAYLRDSFRGVVPRQSGDDGFRRRFLGDGNLDPDHAPPIGFSHMTTAAEFRALFKGFEELDLIGVESFAAVWQGCLRGQPAEEAAQWLDVIEETGRTPEGIGQSDHFLFAGRKKE